MPRVLALIYGTAAVAAGAFTAYDATHGNPVTALMMGALGCVFAWVSGRFTR
jgi:hypothetical protein